MSLDIGLTSDVGREREINQDSAGVTEFGDDQLVVVADGMGGHVAGEEAARLVVESLFARFEHHTDADPRDNLYYGILDAHAAVLAYAERHGTEGMGSTVVAALIRGDSAWVAHVGDSRLYQLRDGAVVFQTTDHTRVQMMIEMGVLTPAQAKDHPEGNVITRAVGHNPTTRGATFEADVRAEPLDWRDGDSLLLCSDGLYDLVDDREMIVECAGRSAEEASQRLVDLANRRGGHDNISVLVVHRAGGATAPPALDLGDLEDTIEDNAPFTTLEDSIEAPALLDELVDEEPVAVASTQPDVPAAGGMRWVVLGISAVVVLVVAIVLGNVLDTTAVDDDDSAADPGTP